MMPKFTTSVLYLVVLQIAMVLFCDLTQAKEDAAHISAEDTLVKRALRRSKILYNFGEIKVIEITKDESKREEQKRTFILRQFSNGEAMAEMMQGSETSRYLYGRADRNVDMSLYSGAGEMGNPLAHFEYGSPDGILVLVLPMNLDRLSVGRTIRSVVPAKTIPNMRQQASAESIRLDRHRIRVQIDSHDSDRNLDVQLTIFWDDRIPKDLPGTYPIGDWKQRGGEHFETLAQARADAQPKKIKYAPLGKVSDDFVKVMGVLRELALDKVPLNRAAVESAFGEKLSESCFHGDEEPIVQECEYRPASESKGLFSHLQYVSKPFSMAGIASDGWLSLQVDVEKVCADRRTMKRLLMQDSNESDSSRNNEARHVYEFRTNGAIVGTIQVDDEQGCARSMMLKKIGK